MLYIRTKLKTTKVEWWNGDKKRYGYFLSVFYRNSFLPFKLWGKRSSKVLASELIDKHLPSSYPPTVCIPPSLLSIPPHHTFPSPLSLFLLSFLLLPSPFLEPRCLCAQSLQGNLSMWSVFGICTKGKGWRPLWTIGGRGGYYVPTVSHVNKASVLHHDTSVFKRPASQLTSHKISIFHIDLVQLSHTWKSVRCFRTILQVYFPFSMKNENIAISQITYSQSRPEHCL